MSGWFDETIVSPGRLPLFCFFACLIAGFVGIRLSTRMIRAGVRWWPGNVTPGGLHIHHVVFGVVLMLLGGVTGLAVPAGYPAVQYTARAYWAYRPLGCARNSGSVPNSTARPPRAVAPETTAA